MCGIGGKVSQALFTDTFTNHLFIQARSKPHSSTVGIERAWDCHGFSEAESMTGLSRTNMFLSTDIRLLARNHCI
eukprot:1689008-Amphidinium_carterae.2